MTNKTTPKVRVYMACSLDGYIAGQDNDLTWLNRDHAQPGDLPNDAGFLQFDQFMREVGCLLMGRTTYDTIEGMGQWVYGDVPVLVATRRPIENPISPTVCGVEGSIAEIIQIAKTKAGSKDVYLDGGNLIQQALSANLVNELTLTYIPILLTKGTRLFDHIATVQAVQFTRSATFAGMLQIAARMVDS